MNDEPMDIMKTACKFMATYACLLWGLITIDDIARWRWSEAAGDALVICQALAVWFACRTAEVLLDRWRDRAIARIEQRREGQ